MITEMITATRSELVKIYTIWCKEAKENTELFESVNVNKMTDDDIKEYSESCADYLIEKLNGL
jgi:hypothetical protein